MPLDTSLEKIDLFFEAKNLPKLHTFNVTDAFLVAFMLDKQSNTSTKIGRTEVINDNKNPTWSAALTVDYMFELVQEVQLRVYHFKAGQSLDNESHHELIGQTKFEVSRLMRATNQKLVLQLEGAHAADGSLQVRAEAQINTRDLFCVTFSCNNLTNKDGFFGTSDPFVQISRLNEDGTLTLVWKSERIDNSLNPRWGEVKLPMATLCNNDLHRPLQIELLDWDSNGKHASMGIVNTSVAGMLSANNAPFDINEKNNKGKGKLTAANTHIEHHFTFAEYVAGGLELSLVVAIDYTGSNGDPTQPGTLHYIDPAGYIPNQYQDAIKYVGQILEPYDADKRYTVLGFGARVKQADGTFSTAQHCIPIPTAGGEVTGVDGILEAYKQSLPDLMLSGPTLLAPLVSAICSTVAAAGCRPDRQRYTVLLVLTDGTINDMEQALSALIQASAQPMSVIIVGVGSADFTEMKALDGDKGLLKVGTRVAERDIVQFVALQDNLARGMPVVAQQVLAEVPTQLLAFMEKRGINPAPRK
jgi:hypothetical protein